ncbi:putative UDP-rhamnose:rhamnosyltransferase 1 [Ananas comosus]|uniref:Putative UDP-rhamnose:rhamnosyltransferase 1 n=1 Tax=Ananas comosus TaxID=4615 RepID=A0A199V1P2_ANACO|nr:putative UDP-rhamnose:rhamnosyltransferase 1 [Ananas comosus]
MEDGPLHVVAFPWPAFGHMLPFLELSKSLAERGHRVSFISTPRNLRRLPQIPPGLSPLVDFISFPLPHVDGLPPDAESTNDISPDQIQYLKKALDGLKTPFADFLKDFSKKPDWIIVDYAQYWLPPVAAEFGIPCAHFSILPASSLAFFGPPSVLLDGGPRRSIEEYTRPPEWIPSSSIAYRLHEARWVVKAHCKNASGVSTAHRLGAVVGGCRFVAVRTVNELESDSLRLLAESIYKKPVIPVGLLAQAPQPVGDARAVIEWLDAQSPGTVVYVAFGSEATVASELVEELACGLELSNVPFLWAYRQPGDLTRGSVIEGLRVGHPLIMLPLIADQGLIARVMAGKKVGVEVPRDEQDGSFTREGVAEAVRMVMLGEEGKAFGARAKEMMEIFADDGSSSRHMDEFVGCLRNCAKD